MMTAFAASASFALHARHHSALGTREPTRSPDPSCAAAPVIYAQNVPRLFRDATGSGRVVQRGRHHTWRQRWYTSLFGMPAFCLPMLDPIVKTIKLYCFLTSWLSGGFGELGAGGLRTSLCMVQKYPSFPRTLLPQAPGVQLMDVTMTAHELVLELAATCASMPCPVCEQPSRQIHSHYRRSLADLPWAGRSVRIALSVRKFFCRNAACPRRIFTERLPTVVTPYAQKTIRLTDVHRLVGFALGGEVGVRLVDRLGMPTSSRTLLRLLRQTPLPSPATPRVLGVDEWAFRRGRCFGTILVDLERHQPIDLLPDSSDASFAA